jgi:hypothetical protein
MNQENKEHEHHHNDHHIFYFGDKRMEAPQPRMKVSELKQLIAQHVEGFNTGYTLVFEEHGDRPDKRLFDDEEIHIHDFPHFYDQPPANFGLSPTPPVVQKHFERLKERHPGAALSPLPSGAHLITVPGCSLPQWRLEKATIRFLAPNGYSVAGPDCFWVEPQLSLNGQNPPQLPKNSAYNSQIPETEIKAHWFSWHVDAARGGKWSPNLHDFITWLNVCFERLEIIE